MIAAALFAAAAVAPTAADVALSAGETRSFRLEQHGLASYAMTLPAGAFTVTLDARRADAKPGRLHAELVIRSQDGVLVQHAAFVEDVEVERRGVARITVPRAGIFTCEVRNEEAPAGYWLTVTPAPQPLDNTAAAPFVPLFGDVQPRLFDVRGPQTGRLDKGEHAYFLAALPAGVYEATLEFSNPNGSVTPLAGTLSLLDRDGDMLQALVRLDANDVNASKQGVLSLSHDSVVVFKVFNQGGASDEYYRVDFTLALTPASR